MRDKLQNIISGYKVNDDDAAWLLALEARLRESEARVERLSEREGKAKISLCYNNGEYPFNFMDLDIVDYGVSDNCYVVTNEEIEKALSLPSSAAKVQRVLDAARELCQAHDENWALGMFRRNIGSLYSAVRELDTP